MTLNVSQRLAMVKKVMNNKINSIIFMMNINLHTCFKQVPFAFCNVTFLDLLELGKNGFFFQILYESVFNSATNNGSRIEVKGSQKVGKRT